MRFSTAIIHNNLTSQLVILTPFSLYQQKEINVITYHSFRDSL